MKGEHSVCSGLKQQAGGRVFKLSDGSHSRQLLDVKTVSAENRGDLWRQAHEQTPSKTIFTMY